MLKLSSGDCHMSFVAQNPVFWQRKRQLKDEDVTVNVTVESANKGGLLVNYGQYEGFVPVSQFGPVRSPTGAM